MKACRILILCLIGLFTNFAYATTETNVATVASSETHSFFINVSGANTNNISGQIYCSEDCEYTFTFGYNGSESYRVVIGDTVLTPNNGSDLRQFTITLRAGYTNCSVSVIGTSPAYARLTIDAINGNTSAYGNGYGDLTATL